MAADTFLEVTREPEALKLEPGGSATITYVVTNRTGKDDYVRAVLPEVPELKLKMKGEPQQRVSSGGTASFAMEVAIAVEAIPGNHDVKVEFVAALTPDRAHGAPAARVTVLPPKPVVVEEKKVKHFPWALVLSIAGVILLGGGIGIGVWLISKNDTGEACASVDDCTGGHSCTTAAGEVGSDDAPGLCLKLDRQPCTKDDECEHGYCQKAVAEPVVQTNGAAGATGPNAPASVNATAPASAGAAASLDTEENTKTPGQCQARSVAGGACTTSADCVDPATCGAGTCALPVGSSCESDAACQTRLCGVPKDQTQKVCLALPTLTAACTEDKRCGPGLACSNLAAGPRCLVSLGGECVGDGLCDSGLCLRDRCTTSPAVGAPCMEGRCGMGMSCDRGLCLKPGGQSCAGDGECVSQRCDANACASLGALKDPCKTDNHCTGGLTCINTKCMRPVGAACSTDDECGTSMCTAAKCQQPRLEGETCNDQTAQCGGCLRCQGTCVRDSQSNRLCYISPAVISGVFMTYQPQLLMIPSK